MPIDRTLLISDCCGERETDIANADNMRCPRCGEGGATYSADPDQAYYLAGELVSHCDTGCGECIPLDAF
jgi:hypothetical protein